MSIKSPFTTGNECADFCTVQHRPDEAIVAIIVAAAVMIERATAMAGGRPGARDLFVRQLDEHLAARGL